MCQRSLHAMVVNLKTRVDLYLPHAVSFAVTAYLVESLMLSAASCEILRISGMLSRMHAHKREREANSPRFSSVFHNAYTGIAPSVSLPGILFFLLQESISVHASLHHPCTALCILLNCQGICIRLHNVLATSV